ncbi:A disintegrin and metalloproteinase with thrombospondin motifs 18, partial [Armadillidium nasatum]
ICLQGYCKEIDQDILESQSKNRSSDPSNERTIPIRHNPQHGDWSTWSSWGSCSLTCGTGAMFRTRECNNPEPRWGGRQCEGKREEWKLCSTDPCPNPIDLRAEQCKNLPNLYKIGRRKAKLNWLPFESKRLLYNHDSTASLCLGIGKE